MVLYYQPVPFRNRLQSFRGFFKRVKDDIYFTAFVYDDPELGECMVTRTELCGAFTTLVKAWQRSVRVEAEVYNATRLHPFKGRPATDPDLYRTEVPALTEGKGWGRCDVIVPDIQRRLPSAADYFGQYLSFLSDAEDKGMLPNGWYRYPGILDDENVRLKSTGRYTMKQYPHSNMDDYAFRASRIINSTSTCCLPAVEEAIDLLRGLTRRALSLKVYSPEDIDKIFAQEDGPSPCLVRQRRLLSVLPIAHLKGKGIPDPAYSTTHIQESTTDFITTRNATAGDGSKQDSTPPPYTAAPKS